MIYEIKLEEVVFCFLRGDGWRERWQRGVVENPKENFFLYVIFVHLSLNGDLARAGFFLSLLKNLSCRMKRDKIKIAE